MFAQRAHLSFYPNKQYIIHIYMYTYSYISDHVYYVASLPEYRVK